MNYEAMLIAIASAIGTLGWAAYLGLMHSPSYGTCPKRFSKRRHIVILSILIPCSFIFARMIYLKETGQWTN